MQDEFTKYSFHNSGSDMEFIEIGITPLQGMEGKDMAFTPRETTLAGGSLKYHCCPNLDFDGISRSSHKGFDL